MSAAFHSLDFATLPVRDAYAFLIGAIVPRPIAFVSTLGPDDVPNLAPFSFFTGVTSHPPTIVFSVIRRRGEKKDTVRNLELLGECVVHVVDEALASAMNTASGDWPYGVSEFTQSGLTAVPSQHVRPPRVLEAPVAMECRVVQMLDVGVMPHASTLVIAEVVWALVRDDVATPRGMPDDARLHAIARLGGARYARTRDLFEMARPVVRHPLAEPGAPRPGPDEG